MTTIKPLKSITVSASESLLGSDIGYGFTLTEDNYIAINGTEYVLIRKGVVVVVDSARQYVFKNPATIIALEIL